MVEVVADVDQTRRRHPCSSRARRSRERQVREEQVTGTKPSWCADSGNWRAMAPITSECVSRSNGASNVESGRRASPVKEDGDPVHHDVSLVPTLPTALSNPAPRCCANSEPSLEASPAHRAR